MWWDKATQRWWNPLTDELVALNQTNIGELQAAYRVWRSAGEAVEDAVEELIRPPSSAGGSRAGGGATRADIESAVEEVYQRGRADTRIEFPGFADATENLSEAAVALDNAADSMMEAVAPPPLIPQDEWNAAVDQGLMGLMRYGGLGLGPPSSWQTAQTDSLAGIEEAVETMTSPMSGTAETLALMRTDTLYSNDLLSDIRDFLSSTLSDSAMRPNVVINVTGAGDPEAVANAVISQLKLQMGTV